MAKGQGLREDLLSTVYALTPSELYTMCMYSILQKHLCLIPTVVYFFNTDFAIIRFFFKKITNSDK